MTDPNRTIRKLAEITDAALFERLATAVLRSCKPSLYENLSHPGVNSDGKTVKAPLDGIGWVRDAGSDRVIAAAHSTCEQKDIEKKWLHDPATVKPRKTGNKPSAPEGDLRKAIREISAFRLNQPSLQATFALTSNREPDQKSIVTAQQLASKAGVDLDIWSASRIAQYLDSAHGQWLRKVYFGDSVEFVSAELLQSCTQRNLLGYIHLMNPAELIDRETSIERSSGHTLLVGPSGVGKTTIALQILKRHAEAGGTGLVIPHETIVLATYLTEAIDIELRKLEPDLQPDSGHHALSLASENLPFIIVIEDINAASDPPMVLNKVVNWILSSGSDSVIQWRLICPVWPRYIDSLNQKLKDSHISMLQAVNVYTDEQAEEAIQKKSQMAGSTLLPATISSIAKALGNDPLLIALCDFSNLPDATKVVDQYIERELALIASNSSSFHRSDIRDAIDSLVRQMLIKRKLNPTLREINVWLRQESSQREILNLVFKAGSVLRLVPRSCEDILVPRHDRVMLSLFSHIMSDDLRNNRLNKDYLADPFYAEAVGSAILHSQPEPDQLNWLIQTNPLSLFYAFHLSRKSGSSNLSTIIHVIKNWLSAKELHCRKFQTVRFFALQILAETDSTDVLAITNLFPKENQNYHWYKARFRNGDLDAGLNLLTLFEFGTRISGQDELLKHVLAHSGSQIAKELIKLLNIPDLNKRIKTGCLYLAGYLGDPLFAPAILTSWNFDKPENRELRAYLWASARCYDAEMKNVLESVCDAWAELPESEEDQSNNLSKYNFAADGISWEFQRNLPIAAIPYFVEKARTDDRLEWPITYMLRNIDHPVAVEHIASFIANRTRNLQPGMFDPSPNFLLNGWEHQQRKGGIRMSSASKNRLLELAFDPSNDLPLRKSAFRVWEISQSPGDINHIKQIDKTSDLYEKAIWARARRGDKTVIPQLIELTQTNPSYWWQAGRYLWSNEMTEALHQSIRIMSNSLTHRNNETNAEWILSERIMEIDQQSAEHIIIQEWENLKYSPRFVQVALYLATPQLAQLAKEAITQAAEPARLLSHVTSHMGWKTQGRTGITRFEQVKLLCDYIDLLSEHDIYALWEICNERHWIDFRKMYLDGKLAQTEHFGKQMYTTIDFSILDKAIEENTINSTRFWIEHQMRSSGKTLPELVDSLFDWLNKHQTQEAFEIIAGIFQQSAKRTDLERLQGFIEHWPHVQELMDDLAFSIKKRTLD